MATTLEEKVTFPIKEIITDIVEAQGITLVQFEGEQFITDEQKEAFPGLWSLTSYIKYEDGRCFEIEEYDMTLFEGSKEGLSVAYIGSGVKWGEDELRETGLIMTPRRSVFIDLKEGGLGKIRISDTTFHEAFSYVSEDCWSFGGGTYQENIIIKQQDRNQRLPGVKNFIFHLLNIPRVNNSLETELAVYKGSGWVEKLSSEGIEVELNHNNRFLKGMSAIAGKKAYDSIKNNDEQGIKYLKDKCIIPNSYQAPSNPESS